MAINYPAASAAESKFPECSDSMTHQTVAVQGAASENTSQPSALWPTGWGISVFPLLSSGHYMYYGTNTTGLCLPLVGKGHIAVLSRSCEFDCVQIIAA